ncbi:Cation diffusion facilitator family transporter [uncultured Alphaproteobacteria bacterium]|uniref:Cation diffusion facilitator family transporter n=1 Tax=uncultured Alphaproteobacteria bacterium TaxID=91750 RepID=A0A212KM35_9PROT|nr:Cation diffusion facilitator family transporter [uncultured Alphaproteobacteria bacterium]
MHHSTLGGLRHDHVFGQDRETGAERRVRWVVAITAAVMGVEIAAGLAFGSMALLADGLHMATHALALGLAAAAYFVTRRRAADARFSFGTGKVNALAGFASALFLLGVAVAMTWESVARWMNPVAIAYGQAIAVAVVGLVVNLASMLLLGDHDHEHHDHAHDRHHHHHDHDHEDTNRRAAYVHVLADALTSVLAIAALAAGWGFGAAWLDPLVAILGAALIVRWAVGLLRDAGGILLDLQGPADLRDRVRDALMSDGDAEVPDLHLWSIGVGRYAAVITVIAYRPLTPEAYKARLAGMPELVHTAIEIHACPGPHG